MPDRKILKFDHRLADEMTFVLPLGSGVLDIKMGDGRGGRGVDTFYLWALCPAEPEGEEHRTYRVFGTSFDNVIDVDSLIYHSTHLDGTFVWHLFEDVS